MPGRAAPERPIPVARRTLAGRRARVGGDGRLDRGGPCIAASMPAMPGHLPAEQLAHLGQVAGDAVLLPGELVDLALRGGPAAFGVGLGLGQQLVGLGLGLGDDLVGVLLRVADQLPGVLVGVAPGLVGLRADALAARCSAVEARCSASETSFCVAAWAAASRSASWRSASSRRAASWISNSASAWARWASLSSRMRCAWLRISSAWRLEVVRISSRSRLAVALSWATSRSVVVRSLAMSRSVAARFSATSWSAVARSLATSRSVVEVSSSASRRAVVLIESASRSAAPRRSSVSRLAFARSSAASFSAAARSSARVNLGRGLDLVRLRPRRLDQLGGLLLGQPQQLLDARAQGRSRSVAPAPGSGGALLQLPAARLSRLLPVACGPRLRAAGCARRPGDGRSPASPWRTRAVGLLRRSWSAGRQCPIAYGLILLDVNRRGGVDFKRRVSAYERDSRPVTGRLLSLG